MNYYNEFDPKTAAWLRQLIKNGAIPDGHVDERSITDVSPSDLKGYVQCHFFAGIGGWSYALQLAGWPSDLPVWTGSCPCQPFSVAGKGLGIKDERHLWPVFAELIRQCQPPAVFGEQVASKAGRDWLAGVFADLEAMGYSRAGADLCAAGVGAPHIRQRLYWMAYNDKIKCSQFSDTQRKGFKPGLTDSSTVSRVGNAVRSGWEGSFHVSGGEQSGECEPRYKRIIGADGKARRIPIEPELYPLANGLSGRVGLLRGYGNAIVPQCAQAFIEAFLDIQNENMHKM